MRGKECLLGSTPNPFGITPAYAGKRNGALMRRTGLWDHPRVCGEKNGIEFRDSFKLGSPPRMRGKGESLINTNAAAGITPAYAGKSEIIRNAHPERGDHPRVCGEKSSLLWAFSRIQGSPPRMRGKEMLETLVDKWGGITPAYAGKRLKRSHSIGHFSCILCLFHSVLHRASASGGSRAGPRAPPCLPAQNTVPV